MATTLAAGVSFTTVVANSTTTQTLKSSSSLNYPWRRLNQGFNSGRMFVRTNMSSPDLSEQVTKSIKDAEEACAGDPISGECAAAWDEVEEVSAAASDKRLQQKQADPLETYCKDNPETDECRTYDS